MQNTKKGNIKVTLTNQQCLAKYLGCTPEELTEERNGAYSYGREEYLVLTDSEAEESAKDYILDSLWAFNYDFLCGHSKAIAEIPKEDYEAMAGKLCESFNNAVKAMIDNLDHFIDDAIKADGRGHFISAYDGEENEEGEYFIYRIN